MTIKMRIAAAATELERKGGHPTRVLLTNDNTTQLQYEVLAEGGAVGYAVMQHGVCKTMTELLGLQIIWRSSHFEVV